MSHKSFITRTQRKLNRIALLIKKTLFNVFMQHPIDEINKPIFVSGVQRSGTNMVMRVFENSMYTYVFHERDNRAFEKYEMKDISVISELIATSKAHNVVIKALCECQDISYLLDIFKNAKVVWVVRNYHDVVQSHLKLWTGMPDTIRRLASDSNETVGWRGRKMSSDTRSLVKNYYYPGINNASSCALFWYFRNILFFEQKLENDDRVFLVKYEDMVFNPRMYFEEIFNLLDIPFHTSVVRHVGSRLTKRTAGIKLDEQKIDPKICEICDNLQNLLHKHTLRF